MLNAYTHPKKMKKEDVKALLLVAAFFAVMFVAAVAAKMYMPTSY